MDFENYEKFLESIDCDLEKIFEYQSEYLCCKRGCSLCCERGDYPLSRLEFEYLKSGFNKSDIDIKGYFKYYKVAGKTVLNNKEFTHYIIYKGTSEYNTKEMSIFIDGVVQEAKQLGIETKTPKELEEMKERWKKYEEINY